MAVGTVTPIVGKLRRNFNFDLAVSLIGGTIFGYVYWYVPARINPLGRVSISPRSANVGDGN